MKTWHSKPMGCSKSSPKKEVYSNTILPQKTMKETIVKINKTKSWFFEKINKIDIKIKKREESNKQN